MNTTRTRVGDDFVPVILILSVLALALFWRTLGTFFGVDDFYFVMSADRRGLYAPSVADFFARRYMNEIFSFTIARRLFGDLLWAYHTVALVAHVLCGLLVYKVAKMIRPGADYLAALAALFFVLHPMSYSVLAWVALGFNEPFALAIALVGVICFLRFVEKGGAWRAIAAILCLPVAAGFKNQAVMMPAVYAALGFLLIYSRWSGRLLEARSWVLRAAVVIFVCGVFSVWYALVVVPLAPQAQHPAFARDWRPLSMIEGYSQLLFGAINPFALFRERLGYQAALPDGFPIVGGSSWTLLKLGIVGVVLFAGFMAAKRRQERMHWLVLVSLSICTMSFAAAMPHHRYEYYAYFSLATFAIGMSYLGVWLRAPSRPMAGSVAAAGLLAVISVNGCQLHRSNDFVRQADNAEVGVSFAKELPPNSHIHFIRPDVVPWQDLVQGAAFRAMLPGTDIAATFGHKTPKPFSTTRMPDAILAYFEPRPNGPGVIRVLDSANDDTNAAVNLLASAGSLIQALPTTGQPIAGVGVLFGTHAQARRCGLSFEVHAVGDAGTRQILAAEKVRCRDLVDNAFHVVMFEKPIVVEGGALEVEVSSDARDDAEAVAVWLNRPAETSPVTFKGGEPNSQQGFIGASLGSIVIRSAH